MPILKGSSGTDAELVFAVYTNDNQPVDGHSFVTGQVKVRLPGSGSFVNATIGNIQGCGKGQYVLRLTSAQTNVSGLIAIKFSDGVNRDSVNYDVIGSDSTTLSEVLFEVKDGLTGMGGVSFSVGDVEVRAPGGSAFTDADLAQVTDLGEGLYAYQLTPAQQEEAGAYMVYYSGTYDPYYGYEHSVGVASVTPTPPDPLPAPAEEVLIAYTSHGEAMLARLCEYSKADVLD